MATINQRAYSYWQSVFGFSDQPANDETVNLYIADTLPSRHSLLKLVRHDDKTFVAVTRPCANQLSLTPESCLPDIESAMSAQNLIWYDDDAMHYFSDTDEQALLRSPNPTNIRQLTEDDANVFDRFHARMPAEDWDEVEPELDNEAVFGHFDQGELCSVADYYRWQQTPFADLGVITAPDCRGRGVGAAVVKALSAHALRRGLVPQYRAQLSNLSSLKISQRLGLQRFGLWTVAVAKT
ncbi:GNAT family N-acetyltransferase [Reinekea blandensis]|uniref:Probable acetyltransferase n=1 Tax=Reinekea blandensis MED297 TaxID=314283 RepID=A4BB40_9GAMM|nr:GNAT family N-acetyltransferase [Reinekea blandensis]EAR10653.1 probable acetyltransferase [Reinekea sp. MED297] [Reinekea blandensis MED297]